MLRIGLTSLIFATCSLTAVANDLSAIKTVYPSGQCVPSNILRMHLVFTQAMERGQVQNAVSLHRENGDRIDSAFLGIELWNPDQTVLTLLFEPGRIKRGVGPNNRVGPVLTPSQRYYVRVAPPLKQAQSRETIPESLHRFCTVAPQREPIATNDWSADEVRQGTRDPLVIRFDRMMDVGSVSGRLRITRDAKSLRGEMAISPDGTFATFQPKGPWAATNHFIAAHPAIEDVAGNRLGLSFDAEPGAMRKVSYAGRYPFRPGTSEVRE